MTTVPDDEKYVVFLETVGEEWEQIYYFIKWKGNERSLQYLNDQLTKIDWFILDELNTFDLDLEHFVSAQTAKEMTKIELNSVSFHRKFDGTLKMIDLGLKKKHDNETKICKVNDKIGGGGIEEFIDGEDIDPEDLCSDSDTSQEGDTEGEEALVSQDKYVETSQPTSEVRERKKKEDKKDE